MTSEKQKENVMVGFLYLISCAECSRSSVFVLLITLSEGGFLAGQGEGLGEGSFCWCEK